MGHSTEGQDDQGAGGQEGKNIQIFKFCLNLIYLTNTGCLPMYIQQGGCQGKMVLQGRGNPSK